MTCAESMRLYNGCVIILKDPLDEKFELDNDDHVSTPLRKHAGSMITCDDVHQENGWTHPVTGECIPWKYVRYQGKTGYFYIWPNHIECIVETDEVPPDAYSDPDELFAV